MTVCKSCGRQMVRRYTGTVLTSYPAQYPWYWWCACGQTAEGGVERGLTEDEEARRSWQRLNNLADGLGGATDVS